MGFLLFPIYGMFMGLRLAALRAAGAPLSSYKCGVEKIKLSRLLGERINEFKMNEIQRKTPQ